MMLGNELLCDAGSAMVLGLLRPDTWGIMIPPTSLMFPKIQAE